MSGERSGPITFEAALEVVAIADEHFAAKSHMKTRPDLLTFDPQEPHTVGFDAEAAGASDEILALIERDAGSVADMAANVLKECDPDRHTARMSAVSRHCKGQAPS